MVHRSVEANWVDRVELAEDDVVMEGRRSLSDLATATPSGRDRYVDFLRGFSIAVVVLGHWLIAVVVWDGNRLSGANALDLVPGLWLATWVLQVMPLFFFVGGFSNLVTYEALVRMGEGGGSFLKGRMSRLLRPTLVFAAMWAIALPLSRRITLLPDGAQELALPILAGPLWFLGVYMLLVAFTPLTVPLHRRYRRLVLVALALGVIAVDLIRFGLGVGWIGLLNILLVWLLVHQAGYFYADGSLARVPKSLLVAMAIAGFVGMLALTSLDVYPGSMVGRPSDEVSNMAPPTLPMLAHSVWQIGLAMLLRPYLSQWLRRRGPWKLVIAINAAIMTLFLWHLSALILTVGVSYPLGFPQPEAGSGWWWLTRPVWILLLAVVLAVLLLAFGRFERPDLDPAEHYWNLEEFYTL
jgi:fucose 4-O-acetylase-like acetyltransferase